MSLNITKVNFTIIILLLPLLFLLHILEAVLTFLEPILITLRDGGWHSIKEVQEYSGYYEGKTALILEFLSGFGFVDLRKNEKEVKLSPPMFKFIAEIEKLVESTHQNFQFRIGT
jgi:hypothetical protein